MGGLCGLVHFRGEAPDPEIVARMSARQARRGPDGAGAWASGPAAFAHRLRKVAPTRSVQPVVDDDLVLLLDGWIYDHEDVARASGQQPGDRTDAEVLIGAWRRWGLDFPAHVDGAFAVALWDRNSQTLVLVRDRIGARPLYWARDGDRFAFASELPALLEVPWVGRELAREHVAEYLSFQVVHAPRTLLRDVHQLEPAHWLQIHADALRTRRWWSLRYAPPGTARPREGEVIDALQEAVQRAVRRRVPRGVETGLYLSGGLGSTAIAAAARERFLLLPSFTLRFDDDPHPESPFAGRVARLLGLEHHEVTIGSADLASAFEETVGALGHPVGNPASLMQQALARAVRVRVPVALSGDGSEELFGGRMLDRLGRALKLSGMLGRLPGVLRSGVSRALGRVGRRLVTPPDRWLLELGIGGTHLFDADQRGKLLRDHGLVRPGLRAEVLAPFYQGLDTDPLNMALHGYLCSTLAESALVRADRTAAAAGLEVRFPLLDREILDMAAALPGAFKLRRVGNSLHTRWPLRAMLSGVLPPPLVNRPKRSMPAPLDGWLAGHGRLFMEERFARLKQDRHRLWRAEALDDLRRNVSRREGSGIRLWTLFILDAWLDGLQRS